MKAAENVYNFFYNTGKKGHNWTLENIGPILSVSTKAIALIAGIALASYTGGSSLSIPAAVMGLANGGVVPPNREFLAVLGDNKKEPEIVSPVSTMKQAFTEAMLEMGGNFGGGKTEVVLEIDGREFGRAVVEQGNRENRRIGTRLVIA